MIVITICVLNIIDTVFFFILQNVVLSFVGGVVITVGPNFWHIAISSIVSLLLYQGLPFARWLYVVYAFLTSITIIVIIPQAMVERDILMTDWIFMLGSLVFNACSVWLLFANKTVEEFLYEKEVDWHERIGKHWKW